MRAKGIALAAIVLAAQGISGATVPHVGMFNPSARLDASQVIDRRGEPRPADAESMPGWFCVSYATPAGLGWVCVPPIEKDSK